MDVSLHCVAGGFNDSWSRVIAAKRQAGAPLLRAKTQQTNLEYVKGLESSSKSGVFNATHLANDSGLVTVSSLRNGAIVDSYDLEVVDGDWRLAAVGDVDGDGTDDIVWQRRSNGLIHYWRMVGGNVQARVDVGGRRDAKRRLEAVCGFFNYFYFVHTDSHRVHGWYVSGDAANGFHIVTSYTRDIFTVTGEWHLRGCGELKESGNNDELIWQHDSGNIIVWRFSQLLLEGHTEIYEGIEIGNPGPSWKVVGAGDVNNDGVAEIVFQQY